MSIHLWPELNPGDVVQLGNRHTHRQLHTTVAETLPAIDGDGPGIVDVTGATYRHFDFTLRVLDARSYEIDRSFAALIDMLEYTPTRDTQ